MDNATKKDIFWQEAFDKYNIIEKITNDGKYEINAKQIKKLGQEPRLMTKFDSSIQLPIIFKKHKLSILPITRGNYIIAPYKTFHPFPESNNNLNIQHVDFPENILSISPSTISSETNAINCAYLSGILENFIEDIDLKPTINGRMKSNEFTFQILNKYTNIYDNVSICNSQIEIDGGFEGAESLTLVEAKNNLADDFIVRQLYYPFRKWKDMISKKINTIYLVYTNNVFHLYDYTFTEPNNYNSLALNKYKKYTFEKLSISINDIQSVLENSKIITEPQIPFPQADNFKRIINLMELLNERNLSKEDITANYAFDKRQTDYYVNAGKYLGLFQECDSTIVLTDIGINLLKQNYRKRQLGLVKLILSHKVFNIALRKSLSKGSVIEREQIIEIMKDSNLYKIQSEETYNRRASTIVKEHMV